MSLVVLALTAGLLLLAPAGAQAAPARAAADVTDGLVLRYDLTQASGTTVTDSLGQRQRRHPERRRHLDRRAGTGARRHRRLRQAAQQHHWPACRRSRSRPTSSSSPARRQPVLHLGPRQPARTRAAGTGYLFASGNAFRAGITTTNWTDEKVTAPTPGGDLARGVWKTVTYTQTGTTGTLFEDGVQVGQNTAVTVLPSAHRRRHDHQQRARRVQLRRRQHPQGQGQQLPHLQPGADRGRGRGHLADRRQPARRPTPSALTLGDLSARHRQPHPACHRPLRLRDLLGLQRPRRHLRHRRRSPVRARSTTPPTSPSPRP